MGPRVTVQSFDWRTLALVGQLAPQLPRAYLTSPRTLKDPRWTAGVAAADQALSTPRFVALMARTGADSQAPVIWSPAFADLKAADVQDAHTIGLTVLPWTVNRRADIARLLDMGVDGLITDFPDVLLALMRERGMTPPSPPR